MWQNYVLGVPLFDLINDQAQQPLPDWNILQTHTLQNRRSIKLILLQETNCNAAGTIYHFV
jgi:hypothetical protein